MVITTLSLFRREVCNRLNYISFTSANIMHDIEDLHQIAVRNQRKTYTDPNTGFTVFTEYAHLKRGRCCGNR